MEILALSLLNIVTMELIIFSSGALKRMKPEERFLNLFSVFLILAYFLEKVQSISLQNLEEMLPIPSF